MIEIVREPNGPVTIRISEESIEDVKEILVSLFREGNFAQNRIQALSSRFEDLEASIGQLITINKELADALAERREGKRMHLPARGTKYYRRLWELCSSHLDGEFTSDDVPPKERHILSILKNEYDVLEVAERKGRRNFYRIRGEVARQLLKDRGHWFSLPVDPQTRSRTDSLISAETGKTRFLLDVRDAESGALYEFYFPEPKAGEAFQQRLLAAPKG